ncbi:MAG TPA: HTTM domain-containing protein, partial [Pirellulales bacterium]|nr:HTTM domain-containing protein [Pirellulales bacterium]
MMQRFVHDWAADVLAGWNRFWFEPTDPATLGAIRIAAGAMLLYTHLVWSLALQSFFGPQGWLSANAVGLLQQDTYSWSYFWLIKSPLML